MYIKPNKQINIANLAGKSIGNIERYVYTSLIRNGNCRMCKNSTVKEDINCDLPTVIVECFVIQLGLVMVPLKCL